MASQREYAQVSDFLRLLVTFLTNISRSFFILNALDILARSQDDSPLPFCPKYLDSELPLPQKVWESSTAEEWCEQYSEWQVRCPEPLTGREVFRWLRGKHSGREEDLAAWFKAIGPLGKIIFHCAKTQAATPGIDELL
jgi:hypothetical protein